MSTDPITSATQPAAVQDAAPTSANAAAEDDSSSAVTSKSGFKSLGELKEVAPKVYEGFMQGIAQTMIDDMKRGNQRIKEAMKKMREG